MEVEGVLFSHILRHPASKPRNPHEEFAQHSLFWQEAFKYIIYYTSSIKAITEGIKTTEIQTSCLNDYNREEH